MPKDVRECGEKSIHSWEVTVSKTRQFFKCLCLLCLVDTAWGFSIIKVKSSSRVVAKISNDDLFIESGDIFLLERGRNKCLVKALREKKGHWLISTEGCDFKIRKGDQLTYMSFKKRGEARGVASSRSLGNMASKLGDSSKFYFGGLFVSNPKVKYDNFESSNEEIELVQEVNSKYKSLYGVSFGYSEFFRELFYDVRFDLPLIKAEDNDNDDATIQPISLIGNLGFFRPIRQGVYLKFFAGAGLTSFGYEEEDFKSNSSWGGLFQFGAGVIYQNITLDIIYRLINGSIHGEVKKSYWDTEKDVPLEVDYSMSEICFKVGFLF